MATTGNYNLLVGRTAWRFSAGLRTEYNDNVQLQSQAAADDRTIRDSILDTLAHESWAPKTTLNVTVVHGVVDLWGTISNDQERRAICVMAENAPGVTKVIDHLVFVEAYTGTVIEPSSCI